MNPAWLFILAAAALNSVGAFLLKRSQMSASVEILGLPVSMYLVTGGALFATTFLFFTRALKSLPVGLAYPVFVGLSQGVLAVLAITLLGERLSLPQVAGIGIIIAGTIILTAASPIQ